ncbi:glycosyltransferase [Pelagicoccus sp. SDUM812002]|uniref:glycosyltransferase family 2 protein n=1 Tax=Pelagicoccus sp. SDUM812002 TaxID=3041266 RepID=UPI00280D033F|nr:glycosyltransferase [Pelagicoccus sp. SDUM812002]MDQ8188061.1 glycosyltransferase [Pelagicoccus sp. SDUM812002]
MISVVIPSYRRKESMLALLRDVMRQQGVNFEVIVVDDVSDDGSVDAIKNEFPEVKLLVNTHNSGPAVTRNRGVRAAKYEIIVGFDSDVTVPDPNCLAKTCRALNNQPQTTAIAFRLLQPDGMTDDYARWWHPKDYRTFSKKPFETDYFSGTGYAFRKSAMLEAGAFPEYLYMHYEEVILALRTIDRGGRIMYEPSLTVIHHEGQVSRRSEIKSFYKHRNQLLLAYLHYPFFIAIGYILPRSFYTFAKALKGGYLRSYFRSIASVSKVVRENHLSRRPVSKKTLQKLKVIRH